MQPLNVAPPPLPPGLIEVRGIVGYPGYAVGYDEREASVWCWKPFARNEKNQIRPRWKRLKPGKIGKGYLNVILCNSRVDQASQTVHRIVAEAFFGPRPVGLQILHGPAGMLCNLPSNLSYGTARQNAADRLRDGTDSRGEKNARAKLTEADVRDVFLYRSQGMLHREIAAISGVTPTAIALILKRKNWSHIKL